MTDIVEIGNYITLEATFYALPLEATLYVRNQSQDAAYEYEVTDIRPDFSVHHPVLLDVAGEWYYRFVTDVGEIEAAFIVDADTTRAPVVEPGMVRTLIPRIRRAVDGPGAVRMDADVISDRAALALAADAIADLLLYTTGTCAFPYTLAPVSYDPAYNAPDDWQVVPPLSIPAESLVVAQAALNFLFHALRDIKVSETIRDEAGEWTYSRSASLLTKQMDLLTKLRDSALEAIALGNPAWDSYVSFLSVRDRTTAQLVEGWSTGVGGLELDVRFGTIG